MSVLGSNILAGASGAAPAYTIDQSLSCQSVSSGRLSRTFTSAGSVNPKWTFATWYKKGEPTTTVKGLYIFKASSVGPAAEVDVSWQNDIIAGGGGIRMNNWSGSSSQSDWDMDENAGSAGGIAFRDYSAWYHICHVIDYTTSPYVFFYLNGVLLDVDTIYGVKSGPGYGTNYSPVSGDTFYIAGNAGTAGCPTGYQADTYWIEGQALNPVGTFGEVDEDTGAFIPIEYTGTYSGNSFYLDYSDSADFGTDQSGLGNDFTVNALTADQQSLDSPTNNFANWNPLWGRTGKMPVLSEGNLVGASSDAAQTPISATFAGIQSGKWYWEIEIKAKGASDCKIGLVNSSGEMTDVSSSNHDYRLYLADTGNKFTNTDASTISYGDTYAAGDIVGIALDMTNGALYFSKNNTWQTSGDPTSGASKTGAAFTDVLSAIPDGGKSGGKGWVPYVDASDTTVRYVLNAGQDSSFAGEKTAQGNQDSNGKGDFYYTPPTDYLALCTDNLSAPEVEKPGEHFNPAIYTGAGYPTAVTGVGFQPDFVWIKRRHAVTMHDLFDSVRGGSSILDCASTVAATTVTGALTFDSDGFTAAVDPSSGDTGSSGNKFASWNWKAGGAPTADNSAGAGATPTAGSVKIDGSNLGSALAGSIAATRLSANTTSGFSIVTYTGTGVSGATVAHGLSVAPTLGIVKSIDQTDQNWIVGATPLNSNWEKYLKLDTTVAVADSTVIWNDSPPSATVFSLGTDDVNNKSSGTYVAYLFTDIEGYSKVGNFAGNQDADGPFIFTGFRPSMFLLKKYSAAGDNWYIFDNKRTTATSGGYNGIDRNLYPDEGSVEGTGNLIDFVSNGIKIRNAYTSFNGSSTDMIYIAFAEAPMKFANAR